MIVLGLALVVTALVICVLVNHKAKQMPDSLPGGPMPHRHPGKERMVETLKGENLDQSIRLLVDDRNQYFGPYARHIGVDLQEDLEDMLSTRRFVKVLQEIKELPRSKGDAKCELLFTMAFQSHTNICRAIIKVATDPSAPTNHQSLLGPIMGMAAAMFIAADTARLGVLKRQFATLDHWRAEIEPSAKLPDCRFLQGYMPALWDIVITPDRRLQVNVLRLAASRSGNARVLKEVDEACASIQMTSMTFPLVPWNAETTVFELLPDSPLDTSKGVTEYKFYDWQDRMRGNHASYLGRTSSDNRPLVDEEQVFVKKLESIVFQRDDVR